MTRHRLHDALRQLLYASARHRYYPLVVGLIAFASTATFSFPFVLVLIPAVLIAPRRWLILGLVSGLASGVGGALLVEVFSYLGREVVLSRFPQLIASSTWQMASGWLADYGLFALMVVAGSPMPQTPVIFFYSLADPSVPGTLAAVGIGKTVKYVFLAWLISRSPARFASYR
jgi:membrane protein YqaA with SNARE-associated domain